MLAKLKHTELPSLVWKGSITARPGILEDWMQAFALGLRRYHDCIDRYWRCVVTKVEEAYGAYLQHSQLDRPSIRPVPPDTLAEHAADIISFRSCERNLGGLLLHLMPEDVKKACLKTKQTSTLDILYQAHVSAGPGTRTDRHNTLEAVAKGKSVPTSKCYNELQDWKFASTRLVTMGVCHPDLS